MTQRIAAAYGAAWQKTAGPMLSPAMRPGGTVVPPLGTSHSAASPGLGARLMGAGRTAWSKMQQGAAKAVPAVRRAVSGAASTMGGGAAVVGGLVDRARPALQAAGRGVRAVGTGLRDLATGGDQARGLNAARERAVSRAATHEAAVRAGMASIYQSPAHAAAQRGELHAQRQELVDPAQQEYAAARSNASWGTKLRATMSRRNDTAEVGAKTVAPAAAPPATIMPQGQAPAAPTMPSMAGAEGAHAGMTASVPPFRWNPAWNKPVGYAAAGLGAAALARSVMGGGEDR